MSPKHRSRPKPSCTAVHIRVAPSPTRWSPPSGVFSSLGTAGALDEPRGPHSRAPDRGETPPHTLSQLISLVLMRTDMLQAHKHNRVSRTSICYSQTNKDTNRENGPKTHLPLGLGKLYHFGLALCNLLHLTTLSALSL